MFVVKYKKKSISEVRFGIMLQVWMIEDIIEKEWRKGTVIRVVLQHLITHIKDILLVFNTLDAGDEAEEEVHDSGGVDMAEQQPCEALARLDVVDHLKTGHWIL